MSSSLIWTQLGSDIDGEAASEQSGRSISLSSDGTIVAIGANLNDENGTDAGQVRVYQYSGGNWSQKGSDINGEAGSRSGVSVSLNGAGTIVAIGAPFSNDGGNNAGKIRVYEYSSGDWSQIGDDINGEVAGIKSGWSVSLDSTGTILANGATSDNSNTGRVRVYEWKDTTENGQPDTWVQIGSDIDGDVAGDQFGYSLSLNSDGTILASGAIGNDSSTGRVKVYEWKDTDDPADGERDTWVQLGSNIDGDAAGDQFGYSVSLDSAGTKLAIGAPFNDAGYVKVFEWKDTDDDDEGDTWTQLGSNILGEATDDQSGVSISISSDDGSIVAIGAPGNDGTFNNAGQVRVFEGTDTNSNGSIDTWTKIGDDIDGEASTDRSGGSTSVSLSSDGSIVAVAARYNDGFDTNAGHLRIFESIPDALICMIGETFVETDQGEIQIKDLDINYHTIRNKKINAITKIILHKKQNNLIKICKDALGVNKPYKDLYVTNNHHIMYNEKMIIAKNLYNEDIEGVEKIDYKNEILYNVLMDNHTWISTHNVIVETLRPQDKMAKFYLKKIQKKKIQKEKIQKMNI